MELGLFTIAMLSLVLTGCSVAIWLIPSHRHVTLMELLLLSWLLGTAFLPLMALCSAGLLPGTEQTQQMILTGFAVLIGSGSLLLWWRRGQQSDRETYFQAGSPAVRFFCNLVILLLTAIVFWLSLRRVLGWDALLMWEFKARIALQNNGVIPLHLFADPTRAGSITHPEYPLYLPLVELWIYRWLGSADQQMLKLLFPFYFLSAAALLRLSSQRFVREQWQALLPPIALLTIPLAIIGNGSASSGYSDFPLATYYLAAGIYLLEFRETGAQRTLMIAGLLSSLLPWIKQEGIILWFCLLMFALLCVLKHRAWKMILMMIPGVLIFIGWRLFVQRMGTPLYGDFQALSPATFFANIERLPAIATAALLELTNWTHWGLLLPGLLLAFLLMIRRQHPRFIALLMLVLLPASIYSAVYLFSSWTDYLSHLDSSLPRLWLHLVPMALLLIGSSVFSSPEQEGSR